MNMIKLPKHIIILSFLFLLIISTLPVKAQTNTKNLVNIYFFHSKDCSHCQSEEIFLDSLEEKYTNVKIYRYEIHEDENDEIRRKVQELYNINTNGVPLTIIGDTPYSGYANEKSNLIFKKTIEYYSRYSYIDRVGELLQIETSTYHQNDETIPSLDEFIADYGNYNIIGPIYTDDLDLSLNAIVLGTLSQLNVIKIITFTIVLISLSKFKNQKSKLCLLSIYLITSLILNTTYIISNEIYTLIIEIMILILFMLGLLRYIKNKKKQYLYSNIFIITAIISSYLENHFYSKFLNIFKELMIIYDLNEVTKIIYYSNYMFITIIINILLVLIVYSVRNLIIKKN